MKGVEYSRAGLETEYSASAHTRAPVTTRHSTVTEADPSVAVHFNRSVRGVVIVAVGVEAVHTPVSLYRRVDTPSLALDSVFRFS